MNIKKSFKVTEVISQETFAFYVSGCVATFRSHETFDLHLQESVFTVLGLKDVDPSLIRQSIAKYKGRPGEKILQQVDAYFGVSQGEVEGPTSTPN